MNDDLFANLPVVKSPRLLWMERHQITLETRVSSLGVVHVATAPNLTRTGIITTKATNSQHDALVEMALQLNIKLWNE